MARAVQPQALTAQREGAEEEIPEWARASGAEGQAASLADTVLEGTVTKGGPALQSVMDWLGQELLREEESDLAAIESIVAEALAGDSVEEVLRQRLPVSGKNFTDQILTLHGFRILESDFGEGDGAPAYAAMRVTLAKTNEPKVINCGGWTVLAQLKRLSEIGEWPVHLVIKGKKLKNGNVALRLTFPE